MFTPQPAVRGASRRRAARCCVVFAATPTLKRLSYAVFRNVPKHVEEPMDIAEREPCAVLRFVA